MSDSIVAQVREWYLENYQILLALYAKVNLKVHSPEDPIRGKVAIQLDSPLVGATLSFWNKGDVMAIGIDKVKGREFSFDDRVMESTEQVTGLLSSYVERMKELISGSPSK